MYAGQYAPFTTFNVGSRRLARARGRGGMWTLEEGGGGGLGLIPEIFESQTKVSNSQSFKFINFPMLGIYLGRGEGQLCFTDTVTSELEGWGYDH